MGVHYVIMNDLDLPLVARNAHSRPLLNSLPKAMLDGMKFAKGTKGLVAALKH